MANRALYGPSALSLMPAQTQPSFMDTLRGNQAGIGDLLLGAGVGLLSQGPSFTPQSPLQGLGSGLMMGSQLAGQRRQGEMDAAKMAFEKAKFEAAQKAAAAKAAAPAFMNVPGVGLVETNAAGGPSVAVPSVPKDPMARLTAFAEGTPEQQAAWTDASKALAAPPVSLNLDTRKAVGTDAPKYIMPDGSTPSIDQTPAEIAAAGGRAITPAEAVGRRKLAEARAQIQIGEKAVGEAVIAYDAAYDLAKKNPTPENQRDVKLKATEVGLARQQLTNFGRELGAAMLSKITPPGYLERKLEEWGGDFMGKLRGMGTTTPVPTPTPAAPAPLAPMPSGLSAEEQAVWDELQQLRQEQAGG